MLSHLFAATTQIDPGKLGIPAVKDPNAALASALTTVYGVAGVICVITIVIAGYMYVTSDGDASHVKQAKNAIIGAVTGLIVIIGAFTITQFVLGRF